MNIKFWALIKDMNCSVVSQKQVESAGSDILIIKSIWLDKTSVVQDVSLIYWSALLNRKGIFN